MDEFGFGTFSVNCAYGIPKNPLDTDRSCGGSSGGAACLTASADFPHISIAESTGGSISCPAAFTGTVGLTPTYGRVSRWGLIDYANSLDKIGCIGKTVKDVALLLSVISGPDDYDSTVLDLPEEDFTKYLKSANKPDAKGMRIGVPKEYFENVDEKITKVVWSAIKKLEDAGASYKEVSLPHTKYSLPAYYIIAMAESSTNLAKFCGMRYGLHLPLQGNFDEYFSTVRAGGFGEEAKRRIILGTFARMAGWRDAYYLKALKVRTKVIEDFKKVFGKFDVLAAPTMPVVAPRFSDIEKLEPIQVYMMDILTVAPNLAGIPMISVPCGSVQGLPVGLHLMGDHLQEKKIIQAAYAFEQVKK
jgi:aspartyl-tRNA(Asn)/glutamyl-tRNA(Gln) amidotransferase subunit A